MKITTPTEVSIGRRYNTKTEKQEVCIEIRDNISRRIISETFISNENYGKLISGLSDIPSETKWNTTQLGIQKERK